MPRIKTHSAIALADPKPKRSAVKSANDAKKTSKSTNVSSPSTHSLARLRAKAAIVAGVVALLAFGGRAVWLQVAPRVAAGDRYLLPAEEITVNQPPEWIAADVRGQVISNAGLDRRLSVLDPGFIASIEGAFALHPWVASVQKIEKRFPPAVRVELIYRKPVAAIEVPAADGFQLLPVDWRGVRLPAADVPAIRLRYLPRLTGVVGTPAEGQRWDDPRVPGAVDLAMRLADSWESLHLFEIVPSARPEVQGDRRYFVYDLRSGGGTQIVWGAPPLENLPGEDEFAVKLARLKHCAKRYGPLDSVKSPAVIDIRRGVAVTPRTVKKPDAVESETLVK